MRRFGFAAPLNHGGELGKDAVPDLASSSDSLGRLAGGSGWRPPLECAILSRRICDGGVGMLLVVPDAASPRCDSVFRIRRRPSISAMARDMAHEQASAVMFFGIRVRDQDIEVPYVVLIRRPWRGEEE